MEPIRNRLPDERPGLTYSDHLAAVGGARVTIRTGEYDNGTLAEIFLEVGHEGDVLRAYDLVAISMSIGLQYGIPLDVYLDKFKHMRMDPEGITSDKEIPIAKSVIDFVARWLERKYLKPREEPDVTT